ncbi:MAG: ABC transporter ATP-binding protein [Candidatus Latescibacterota bacterium]|nr:ABC transporter ATP-binding protein [Candidatus Latescibacterota bacterium]
MNTSPDFGIELRNVTKTFQGSSESLTVLKDISFAIRSGTSCSIVGPSGSGKTTLLGLCAGLDHASSGKIILNGSELGSLTEDQRARFRGKHVGFVFQNFQLIPTLSALENAMVPLELLGNKDAKSQAEYWLNRVGLDDRLHHYPLQLSGGEQQRVALARAFTNKPKVLFADEPTGNLDGENSERISSLLFDLNRDIKTTLILVTHDIEFAERTDRIISLRNGNIDQDSQTNATSQLS